MHVHRIHDGKEVGTIFARGAKGRVDDCEIWGNADAGVTVQGDGSEAVVAGCKCAGGRAGAFFGGSVIHF